MSLSDLGARAVTEVGDALARALPDQVSAMVPPILQARRIALYGVGREGLVIKALAMRLFHLGLDAHVIGDMTTPLIETGDLLIVSAGPGQFSTVAALVGQAKAAGARTLCVTAKPDGDVPQVVDTIIHLRAQTMANDQEGPASALPMGSLYEAVMFLFFEIIVLELREQKATSAADMRAFHTNME